MLSVTAIRTFAAGIYGSILLKTRHLAREFRATVVGFIATERQSLAMSWLFVLAGALDGPFMMQRTPC